MASLTYKLLKFIFIENPIILFIYSVLGISTIQWGALRFLTTYCAQPGIIGLFVNIMSLGSPICMFVNTIQYTLSTYYITLWTTVATTILTYWGFKK